MIAKPLTIAVAGVTGGVGASTLARGLGWFFAGIGKRTAVLDFSAGFAPLFALAGTPGRRLSGEEGIWQQRTEREGLVFCHAPQSLPRLLSLLREEKEGRRFDVLIADLPSAARAEYLDVFLDADLPLAVMAPDLPSACALFEFVSIAVLRRVEAGSGGRWTARSLGAALSEGERIARFLSPQDVFQWAGTEELREALMRVLDGVQAGIVVSGVRAPAENEIGPSCENFSRKLLSLPVVFVGSVEHDETVVEEGRKGGLFMQSRPGCRAAEGVEKLGRRLVACPDLRLVRPQWSLGAIPDQSYYETLQVSFTSAEFEIRASHQRLTRLFSDKSPYFPLVMSRGRLDALRSLFDDAWMVLGDRMRREGYDRVLGERLEPAPDDAAEWGAAIAITPRARPPARRAGGRAVTGGTLREVRETLDLSLQDIAAITKIGVPYLRAIEEENYVDLPEEVFLKGFLRQIAAILQLDPAEVTLSYLRRAKEGRRD